jgi:hypothetical protein
LLLDRVNDAAALRKIILEWLTHKCGVSSGAVSFSGFTMAR